MSRKNSAPNRDPFGAFLFGTLWTIQPPAGLLAPVESGHSFKLHVSQVTHFGKLRDLSRDHVQNFVKLADGSVYRLAWKSQTRAGRKWVRLHVERCRCPDLKTADGTGKRLQVMRWIAVLSAADIPAEELARPEPLLPGETE